MEFPNAKLAGSEKDRQQVVEAAMAEYGRQGTVQPQRHQDVRGETERTENKEGPLWFHNENSQEVPECPGGLPCHELSSLLCLSTSHTFQRRWHSSGEQETS